MFVSLCSSARYVRGPIIRSLTKGYSILGQRHNHSQSWGWICLALPKSSEGRTHVLVKVDLFSRYVEVQPLSGPPNSDEVTQAFLSKIVLRHGACGAILTDKGSEFMNSIMGEVCERLGIEHVPVPT